MLVAAGLEGPRDLAASWRSAELLGGRRHTVLEYLLHLALANAWLLASS